MRGFQKGHIVSQETRDKISKANNGNFYAICDYCGIKFHTQRSVFVRKKRHFCCQECYSKYRTEIMPSEEQNAFGHGNSVDERKKRTQARSIWNHYVRDKHIKRKPCEVCGDPNAEAHHDDYNRPLEVRWLCFKHHREWHRKNKIFENKELLEK